MKFVKIWFNHWFSAAYHIIGLIRQNAQHNCYVIGTNESKDSIIRLVCDEFHREPSFDSAEEYVQYCAEFCKEHQIDVFVPYREMLAICQHSELFTNCGIRLLLCLDKRLMSTLDDKGATYRYFRQFMPDLVPPHAVVGSLEEFVEAYAAMRGEAERICFKFVQDKGAKSFRVIDERMDDYASLAIGVGNKISYQRTMELLSTAITWRPMIVMPYLEGKSISIDCLATPSGLICVPRYKIRGRVSEVRYDKNVLELCTAFSEHSRMSMPYNYQIRFHGDKPYLLEINSRMSGGIQQSCLAAGVNIPSIAVNQLLGIDIPWKHHIETRRVTHIEMPALL